jgi:hypothetical protein
MSAVLTRRRDPRGRDRERDRDAARQASLFSQVVAPLPLEAGDRAAGDRLAGDRPAGDRPAGDRPAGDRAARDASEAARAVEALRGPTLDAAITSLWTGLLASEPSACPACSGEMHGRHSAGAGVVGGRCGACSLTLA